MKNRVSHSLRSVVLDLKKWTTLHCFVVLCFVHSFPYLFAALSVLAMSNDVLESIMNFHFHDLFRKIMLLKVHKMVSRNVSVNENTIALIFTQIWMTRPLRGSERIYTGKRWHLKIALTLLVELEIGRHFLFTASHVGESCLTTHYHKGRSIRVCILN
jgi:hypothetical protein